MRNLISSKKGQTIQGLPMVIMALIFAGIVLVFGIVVAQELRDTLDGKTTATVTNESVALLAGISYLPSATGDVPCGYTSWNITLMINQSDYAEYWDNATLTEGVDYLIFGSNGTWANLTDTWNSSVMTYDYNWGDLACEGANETVVGLGTFADFWEIIVLAVIISVVIGLLLIVFGGGRRAR